MTLPRIDLEGQKFGKLVVLSFDELSEFYHAKWNCLCDCGNEKSIRSDNLLGGKSKSCGCSHEEYNSKKRGYRTPVGQTSFVKLYANYKYNAKKRDVEFSLTKDQFKKITIQNCHYCNSPPSGYYEMKGANGGILYNGIDRVDSSLGYTLDNVVPCCGFCNRAKIDLDTTEFIAWINRLVSHFKEKEKVNYANW